jgi:hypothetical protein
MVSFPFFFSFHFHLQVMVSLFLFYLVCRFLSLFTYMSYTQMFVVICSFSFMFFFVFLCLQNKSPSMYRLPVAPGPDSSCPGHSGVSPDLGLGWRNVGTITEILVCIHQCFRRWRFVWPWMLEGGLFLTSKWLPLGCLSYSCCRFLFLFGRRRGRGSRTTGWHFLVVFWVSSQESYRGSW